MKQVILLENTSYFWAMEITMTHLEAWDDFWTWIRKQPHWKDIPRTGKYGKQYMYKTDKARNEEGVGIDRVSAILSLHASGRYDFVVILKGQPYFKKEK